MTTTKHQKESPDQAFRKNYDLGLSASLILQGFELAELDRSNSRKVCFAFKAEPGIDETIKDYFADKLEVKAQSMFNAIKSLKNQIYSV